MLLGEYFASMAMDRAAEDAVEWIEPQLLWNAIGRAHFAAELGRSPATFLSYNESLVTLPIDALAGAATACPPACPSVTSHEWWLQAQRDWSTVALQWLSSNATLPWMSSETVESVTGSVLRVNASSAQELATALAGVSAPALVAAGVGVFYAPNCSGFLSDFALCVDPAFASLCAWGAGDDCRACPVGAYCPGGYRVWPQPGYYVSSEQQQVPVLCPTPARERCVGWNGTHTACGVGYRPGSFRCASCDDGFYSLGV